MRNLKVGTDFMMVNGRWNMAFENLTETENPVIAMISVGFQ